MAGLDPVLEEPDGRPRPPGGARADRRDGDPAGDRRLRVAAPARAPRRSAYRAFAAYLGASIVCVSLYTAVKAAYLSTVFATLTEERNLIYLSPLMLIGTALVFESRQIDWRIVAAASAFVVYLVSSSRSSCSSRTSRRRASRSAD